MQGPELEPQNPSSEALAGLGLELPAFFSKWGFPYSLF